jgi:hypothetical protein
VIKASGRFVLLPLIVGSLLEWREAPRHRRLTHVAQQMHDAFLRLDSRASCAVARGGMLLVETWMFVAVA